jgi:hypothetical protein
MDMTGIIFDRLRVVVGLSERGPLPCANCFDIAIASDDAFALGGKALRSLYSDRQSAYNETFHFDPADSRRKCLNSRGGRQTSAPVHGRRGILGGWHRMGVVFIGNTIMRTLARDGSSDRSNTRARWTHRCPWGR